MSLEKSKLMAAISGAIIEFLELEKRAKIKMLERSRMRSANSWSISGLQETMQLKRFYQLRFFKR